MAAWNALESGTEEREEEKEEEEEARIEIGEAEERAVEAGRTE